MPTEIEEKHIEPINIIAIFLLGLAAALFIIGAITSFSIVNNQTLMIIVGIVYFVVAIALLYPKKRRTSISIPEPQIVETQKIVEKPVVKEVIKYKDRPIEKVIEKEVPVVQERIIEKEKTEPKKSKYVGSKYNEKYHLRTCRFAGAIKKEYLIEEDDVKYFKLRGYKPCAVCHPERN